MKQRTTFYAIRLERGSDELMAHMDGTPFLFPSREDAFVFLGKIRPRRLIKVIVQTMHRRGK